MHSACGTFCFVFCIVSDILIVYDLSTATVYSGLPSSDRRRPPHGRHAASRLRPLSGLGWGLPVVHVPTIALYRWVETRIAPRRENWQLSPHRRGVCELCPWRWRVFGSGCGTCGRPRQPLTKAQTLEMKRKRLPFRSAFVHGEGPSRPRARHDAARPALRAWILIYSRHS